MPPKLFVADCVLHLKGPSAYAINHMDGSDGKFKWQEGYDPVTVGERLLGTVIEYVAKQKERHYQNKLVSLYEKTVED